LKDLKLIVLNPPSPPYYDVCREWAGGFGIAWYCSKRGDYGQSDNPLLQPCLPYISSVLSKEGYDFRVLDCQKLRMNKSQVLKEIGKENPDVVISLVGLPSLRKDIELLKSIKETVLNTFIVGIGTTCRVMSREVLLNRGVDAVLRSDYPYVSNLVDLIRSLQQERDIKHVSGASFVKDGKVIDTTESPELDLNMIPPPSYDQLDPRGYHSSFTDMGGEKYEYVSILGSKGCHYGCFYCPYPLGFGKTVTYRNPKDIADEIEYLNSVYGIRGFLFRNQSFTMNRKHALEVCDEITGRKLDIAWFCEARVDEVNVVTLQKMKEAGCKRIHYGVETGEPQFIKFGKPGVSLEATRKAFWLTKKVGLWRTAHVILGWPDETLETLRRTYSFVISLDPDDINFNTITPYPGTKLYEMAVKNSWIIAREWSDYTPDALSMRGKNLTAAQLSVARKEISRDYMKYKAKKLLFQSVTGKRKPNLSVKDMKSMIRFYISRKS
jgi:radical SAM superfamily enzyme YgiQ (UPF0313 family)